MRVYKVRVGKNTFIKLTEEDMANCVLFGLTGFTNKWAEGLDTPKKVLEKVEKFKKGKMVLSEKWDGSDYEFYPYNFIKGLTLFWKNYPDFFKSTGNENEVKWDDSKMTGVEADKIIQYGIYKTVMWG